MSAVALRPPRVFDYLGAVYRLGGVPGGRWVRVSELAEALGVTAPTASIMIRKLEARGLLEVRRGVGARLTGKGVEALVDHLWRHGVVESLLYRAGLTREEAHRVARLVCDMLPRDVVEVVCERLGYPRSCPHGRRIPYPGEALGEDGEYCGLA